MAFRFFRPRQAWLVALAAIPVLAVGWYLTPYWRGVLMAHLDHARGHYEVKMRGGAPLPPPEAATYTEYARLLRVRYAVELNVVCGCVATENLVQYTEGYNSVSRSRLIEKY